jgi:hypothetical protein
MVTRYSTPISEELLAQGDPLEAEGWRVVEVGPPDPQRPGMRICICEDADAPRVLAGLLVEPTFRREADGRVSVIDRRVLTGATP